VSFTTDVKAIRDRARSHMENGPLTPAYEADSEEVVTVLNDVVATEIVCWLRYQQHALVASGIDRAPVAAEFIEHAAEEMQHALWAAGRISQLGGTPDLDPAQLVARSQTDYRVFDGTDLEGMIRENLEAERIVIQTYQEMVRWLGDKDPTTRRLLERILEQEEEHADDLRDLLAGGRLPG
jgi:bacterioferritin